MLRPLPFMRKIQASDGDLRPAPYILLRVCDADPSDVIPLPNGSHNLYHIPCSTVHSSNLLVVLPFFSLFPLLPPWFFTPLVEPPSFPRNVWWKGEMGEDEEPALPPQVELPDTPDCRALTAVLRLYDHARLENKRMGVASSRPGWGVEENIEDWEGVYLDTEDRVVALDVDGDPENRQAVLIGERCFEACCCWALA